MDLASLDRRFPFVLDGVGKCPECDDGWMEEEYVHDPATQSHWRGVRASVCQECGYAERLDA